VLKFELSYIVTSLNPVPNAQVCVYLTVHITKLELQITFPKPLYISHFASIHWDPDDAENLDVCTACDLWDIATYNQRRQICVSFVADIDIKILGVPPLGAGHAFWKQWHMRRGEDYLFLPGFFLPGWCHPWMGDEMNGWMECFTKNDHDILYYIVIVSWRILVSLRGFFEDYICAWWNIWVLIILLLP
jgi:hypothetical protein